jgi:hypothetical protein
MIATALENNGATVYIIGRRVDVIEKAAKENNVWNIAFIAMVSDAQFHRNSENSSRYRVTSHVVSLSQSSSKLSRHDMVILTSLSIMLALPAIFCPRNYHLLWTALQMPLHLSRRSKVSFGILDHQKALPRRLIQMSLLFISLPLPSSSCFTLAI